MDQASKENIVSDQTNMLNLSKKSLEKLFSKNGFKILSDISSSPKTVKELSSVMKISEQAVYYHIKKFLELGIITYLEEIEKLPSTTVKIHRYYLLSDKILLNINTGLSNRSQSREGQFQKNNIKFPRFLRFFTQNNKLNGYVVVGSAITHGKYQATAQDGHYSGYLGYLLGYFKLIPNENLPFIKLDTEINKENLKNHNMLVIGGPKVNVITSELQDNNHLPVQYDMNKTNTILITKGQKVITNPLIGVIQLIQNPWTKNKKKKILIIAGPSRVGTQIAVYAIANFMEKIDNLFTPNSTYILFQGILDNKEDVIGVSFTEY
ncbi:MAG: S-layer protein [Candidatus Hodarchaeales archaeon]|jgi:DNA-binding transcriptional ArsR family regulator